MLAGELYNAADPELKNTRTKARSALHKLNTSSPAEEACGNDVWIGGNATILPGVTIQVCDRCGKRGYKRYAGR